MTLDMVFLILKEEKEYYNINMRFDALHGKLSFYNKEKIEGVHFSFIGEDFKFYKGTYIFYKSFFDKCKIILDEKEMNKLKLILRLYKYIF